MDVRDLISAWKKEIERIERKLEKREKIKQDIVSELMVIGMLRVWLADFTCMYILEKCFLRTDKSSR